jgi:hypothetical protein
MDFQPVSDSAPNPVALFPLTEIDIPGPIKSKETICFYCKLPLSQCSNQDHWDKKLTTENLSDARGMAPKGGKNFISVSSVPGDEAFERIEAKEVRKEIGRVTPTGQSPDPEDPNLKSTRDYSFIAKDAWRAVDALEENRIQHYIEKCPDIELALRWQATFPEYLRDVLFAKWLEKHPSEHQAALDFITSSAVVEYQNQTLDLECSRCREHSELTLTVFGNATLDAPRFTCADCLGRFTRDFTPRSRMRKWPSCKRQRQRSRR